MYVIATAGHVDHGKSTLVHRLTGMWPDRLAEEQRRGLTIDLGFAWTTIDGREIAFVDVPGHERFVGNMLAGCGPMPRKGCVMFVVAATEGWMPQSEEHLAALEALGVANLLVVISKADLADPGPTLAGVRERLPDAPIVLGTDTDAVRRELVAMTDRIPEPDRDADVRLWVDRSFTVRGAGTVVTGTLAAGTLRIGDELVHDGRRVTVRGLQSLGRDRTEVTAVARVAVNLRGVDHRGIARGDTLCTPGAWRDTVEIDVALRAAGKLHERLVLHVGSTGVPVHVRPLGDTAARLRLARPLPLRIGDIGLLRDPGEHRIAAGIDVLDVAPPALRRRGDARARAAELATARVRPPVCARGKDLRAMGFGLTGERVGEWVVDPTWWAQRRTLVTAAVQRWSDGHDIAAGMPAEELRRELQLPALDLVSALVAGTGLEVADGRIRRPGAALPERVEKAVQTLEDRLALEPFRAPESDELTALRLGPKELAAAVRAGRLARIADGVVLGPDVYDRAAAALAGVPQPFTAAEAKRALGTTRRVAIPLLEALDARGVTRRRPDGSRDLAR
ncbi:SelB C-terminal domain-containing protein [Mycolicibacterium rufum]|uniref:SelB C-terminal domain-containing protein n=1 Tax=Mycolicibacterium rufum TaxID=318424 RepID=A0ABY3UK89_9MYCO|nr:selenocysteine-specific translation elongation factor [Mycolicibacterium rufum]KGI66893.1 translation elongation factor [Mycolicibacterium rufum]ULP37732.1 SelB C-terminal domain-containing protein [Mycolicibacterium rufum]